MSQFSDDLASYQSPKPFDNRPPSRLRLFLRHPKVKATLNTAMIFSAGVVLSGIVPLINPPV